MNKYLLLSITSLLFSALAIAEEETLKIVNYQVEPMPLVDKTGKLITEIPTKNLPSPEVEVTYFDAKNEIVGIVDNTGNEFLFDTYDVKLNQGKKVAMPCVKIAKALPEDKTQAGTLGFGKSCK